ncbi:MAG: acetamidase/formamidase family protein [Chloroflexi bacterium]|nr:acetamidase/formamidase family protein [Chloroflexota bacterium]MCL5110421.1 acetamidase/formamidase family protein [Chloroflexota bacterium]
MTELRISRAHWMDRFRTDYRPVAEVECGTPIVFETNPSSRLATGPLFVKGAEPGDALAVTFRRVEVVGDEGVMWAIPGRGVFGSRVERLVNRVVPIQDGLAVFDDRVRIPVRPMVGVVGVAPRASGWPEWEPLASVVGRAPLPGESFCAWPGSHGGNLDCREVVAGATLYLPVAAPGAGLGIGDVHAAMGDGELMLSGVEVQGEVEVILSLRKGRAPRAPLVENSTHLMALGTDKTLEAAAQAAIEHMASLVQAALGLDLVETGMLLSAVGDLAICQLVNAYPTVRLSVEKRFVLGLSV